MSLQKQLRPDITSWSLFRDVLARLVTISLIVGKLGLSFSPKIQYLFISNIYGEKCLFGSQNTLSLQSTIYVYLCVVSNNTIHTNMV